MVKQAQGEKPPVQLLADRISAVFVPAVIIIALLTLAGNWIYLGQFTPSLMRSIAVLVIACPCAMGLATPAAIAVGLGRAARSGILFRNARSLEGFRHIKQVVLDKTGTLTTGEFSVSAMEAKDIGEERLKQIIYSLEKHSNHPIARCLTKAFRTKQDIRWKSIEEVKGLGMRGVDRDGNIFEAGSLSMFESGATESPHHVYVCENGIKLGWVDLTDEIRPEAKEVVRYLKGKGIRTFLLSGDSSARCTWVAQELGIDEVFSSRSPQQKMEKIAALNQLSPTAMVGDGINDAPALSKATIGISLSEASQLAMQNAQVVLMNQGLKKLPLALGLGKHTYRTIQQNLFWAFAYNIIAIPVAAFGFLTPAFGALVMGLSDVVLAINSVRLFVKKVI
jgi:Cu+-exporting ATPase